MPRERVQDPLAGQLGRLGVIATGDTSVAPARVPSGAPDSGLTSFGGSLIRFSKTMQARADRETAEQERLARIASGEDAENKKAAAALYRQYRGDLAKVVESGQLPYGVNPAAWKGFEGAKLDNLGVKYGIALNEAYNQQLFDGSESPDQFESFLSDFEEQYGANVAGADPTQLIESYYPHLDSAGLALRRKFNTDRSNYLEDASVELVRAHVVDAIDYVTASYGDVGSPEAQELVASLARTLVDSNNPDSPAANGMARRTLNDALVDALLLKAEETGDIGILEVLRHINTHGDATLYDIPRYREAVLDMQGNLAQDQMRQMKHDAWVEDRARNQLVRQFSDSGTKLIFNGQNREFGKQIRYMVNNGFSTEAEDLLKVQQAFTRRENEVIETPEARFDLRNELQDSNGEDDVAIISQYLGLVPPSVIIQAFNWAEDFRSPEVRDILDSSRVKESEGWLTKSILSRAQGGFAFASSELTQQAEAANRTLRNRVIDYLKDNGKAPDHNALSDMAAEILIDPRFGFHDASTAAGSTAQSVDQDIKQEQTETRIEGERAQSQDRALGDIQERRAAEAREEAEVVRLRQEEGESTGNVFDSFDVEEVSLPPVGEEVDERTFIMDTLSTIQEQLKSLLPEEGGGESSRVPVEPTPSGEPSTGGSKRGSITDREAKQDDKPTVEVNIDMGEVTS